MRAIQLLSFFILMFIFWQDLKYRAVYWWLFLGLFVTLFILKLVQVPFLLALYDFMINCIFLVAQIVLLIVYFSIKERKRINIFEGYFGLGDFLFLLCASVYLSVFNYVFFYVSSLLIVTFLTLLINVFSKKNAHKIPLAGEQALLFMLFMLFDAINENLSLVNDFKLINYLGL